MTEIAPKNLSVILRRVRRSSLTEELSRNEAGLSAAISATPRSRSIAKPTSCTIRSRAKRLAVSTIMVRTPLPAIRVSAAVKPGRVSIGSAPLTAAS